MKKVHFYLSTGIAASSYEEIIEVEDDLSEETIQEMFDDWIWNLLTVNWWYE